MGKEQAKAIDARDKEVGWSHNTAKGNDKGESSHATLSQKVANKGQPAEFWREGLQLKGIR